MPAKKDRDVFGEAIKNKNQDQIRALLRQNDAKELLLQKGSFGCLPIHDACRFQLDKACLQLILDASVQHGIAKQMVETKQDYGRTCLHSACAHGLSTDSFRLLLEYLLKYIDIKKMLDEKYGDGWTCLHSACAHGLSTDSFRLLLEYLLKHIDIKKMLEEKTKHGESCLHYACGAKLSPDSFRLLFEYLTKHADIKKMLEEQDKSGSTFLHHVGEKNSSLSVDSLRLLISFFFSKEIFEKVLAAKNRNGDTALHLVKNARVKQLLGDPECFEKCRLWLLLNHQDTFLYWLFPNSFEKTCQALKELPKRCLQNTPEHLTIMLIALMPSPSRFRDAVNETSSSAPMSSYFKVVKKGDTKSDYNHWRKNVRRFREFYGQWPPCDRKTALCYEGEGNCLCSCSIQ